MAVTVDDRVVANVISSQVELHKKWGGVVPIIAKRAHEERIDAVVAEAIKRGETILKRSNLINLQGSILMESIHAIAVTQGPGLAPALEVGIRKAKSLATQYAKPLIAVNHMEGHLVSSFAKNSTGGIRGGIAIENATFPLLGLLISGGHTQLVLMNGVGRYELLGETLDDAVGEAYDKVAKMLDLGYPGGPIIEQLAKTGDPTAFDFPVPMRGRRDLDFSYSGLKTALMYKIRQLKKQGDISPQMICDLAASFQRVAVLSLIHKLQRAVAQTSPLGILLGGGVISNLYVRNTIRMAMKQKGIPVYIPYSKKLYTDNAGMIGIAAYFKAKRGEFVPESATLERSPNLTF